MWRASRIVLIASILLSGIGCDQASKLVAQRLFEGSGRIVLLGNTVWIQYVENAGAFLSLGAGLAPWIRTGLFVVCVAGILAFLVGYAVARKDLRRIEIVAVALVAAGGVSNLIDRIWLGSVRDFMNVGIGWLRTGIFNVADVAITAGAVLFLFTLALPSWVRIRARGSRGRG